MLELEDRLRRLAGEHERAARVPSASAAVRRGRRRRRRLAGAATTLTVLSLLAGLVGVRELREPAAVAPPAVGPAAPTTITVPPPAGSTTPGTTILCSGPACRSTGSTVVQHGFEPVEGKVVAEGEQPGFRWRLVIRRAKLPDGQHELVALFERDDYSPPVDLVTLEPVKLSIVVPTKAFPNMHGIVTDRAALVRLQITRGGAPAPPIEVHPTDGGAVFPHNAWFVAFLPEGTQLYRIDLLDGRGQPICSERVGKVKLPGGSETMPSGSCF
jgi:hypothetical protein